MTLQLLWEEYRQANPAGYSYTRFCELYQRWRGKLDVVLRQEHKAGEKMFVDWAGTTMPIYDPQGGPQQAGHLFVAVLGASSYTYAEAARNQQLDSWIQVNMHALEFYGGVSFTVYAADGKTLYKSPDNKRSMFPDGLRGKTSYSFESTAMKTVKEENKSNVYTRGDALDTARAAVKNAFDKAFAKMTSSGG